MPGQFQNLHRTKKRYQNKDYGGVLRILLCQSLFSDRTYLEVFGIRPVINQGRARFFSFGAGGECAKHAYGPSPTAHNAFFLTS
jgi:hypothetical protein